MSLLATVCTNDVFKQRGWLFLAKHWTGKFDDMAGQSQYSDIILSKHFIEGLVEML
jgi:hypothetical protein